MNAKDLADEALLFYDSIPVLEHLRSQDSETANQIRNMIYEDLGKITLICSDADDNISDEEQLVLAFFTAVITGDPTYHEVLKSQHVKKKSFQNKIIEPVMELLNNIRFQEGINLLKSVLFMKKMDEEVGSDNFPKIVDGFYRFAQVITKADGVVSQKEEDVLKKVWCLLHTDMPTIKQTGLQTYEVFKVAKQLIEEETTLDDLLDELSSLVGMNNIKQDVQTLTNLLHVQKARTSHGLPSSTVNLHSVFYGPPGTGKTTIARLIGKIFKQMGLLKKGHLIETDRAGLVAGFVGQTSLKVDEVVNSALDGILFIDEAYALIPDNSPSDYGMEAVNILLKRMEDYRDRLVVIVAGYTDEMSRLMQSNPGIRSRFNRYFYFEDYAPDQLVQIFEIFCKKSNFSLTDDAREKLKTIFNVLYANKDRTFGNARLARNLFEKSIERQANRLASVATLTKEILSSITEDDIPPENQCTGYKY